MNIGIVILATNGYFCLGVRFIRRFLHFYEGDKKVTFYFFSDTDPSEYIPDSADVIWFKTSNTNWVDGTNLKFKSILDIGDKLKSDVLYYFDADTNISNPFKEDWFVGEGLTGGQHNADQNRMKDEKAYDRNPKSKAYVPRNTKLPQMYYYGAFFGGPSKDMIDFCKTMREWQLEDKKIKYEPGVNDESYINAYFHYNPPKKVVPSSGFKFEISHKGGLPDLRQSKLRFDQINQEIKKHKNDLWNVLGGKFVLDVTK